MAVNPHAIAGFREKCGWTKSQLAVQAQLSASHISEIESGKKVPSPEALAKIATALGVNPLALDPYFRP